MLPALLKTLAPETRCRPAPIKAPLPPFKKKGPRGKGAFEERELWTGGGMPRPALLIQLAAPESVPGRVQFAFKLSYQRTDLSGLAVREYRVVLRA
jgi:hypothetical protein